MQTSLLNNIAFDIVKDKVMQDKLKEATIEEQKNNVTRPDLPEDEEEQTIPDIDEPDSEEERIMERELLKRREQTDSYVEKEKEKKSRRYGEVREIVETEFLDVLLKNDQAVVHFYHPEFERCKIMDKHLKTIAESHPDTLFLKINADKTPFFTVKLQVQILPTLILFKDGKAYDRVIGFEELGMRDDFPTINLTRRLVKAKIIKPINRVERGEVNIKKIEGKDEDDDYDY